ncbi:nucleoside-diphosphate-sugar epimerase [Grosmannia clavigera kw1407]|uniref:Nucleoside-diphosphate-sugar epimerase n=1 Tax=Grosmannia clavigera (strain kw1407 / UAMH 11150) TaxID=655863 RepID=F0XQU0_GROCL|nr:nucleoside-diphosphate-sugar epimerase [Grosmannia clavigera kw1407]EFW99899.1 nucleoside-diphosphate-sugar epimerase [Grosmannia clavigera kw1407]
MHLILTGATGLVGSGVLDAVLAMPDVTRISILSRRPVPMVETRTKAGDPVITPDRVRVILHQDFSVYDDSLLEQLSGAAGVVWALGISQTQVDKDEYYKITHDYPLAAARAFKKLPPPEGVATSPASSFRFVYVSGEGATTSPGITTTRFGRVKGETELALAALAAEPKSDSESPLAAISVRPAGVDPTHHDAILPYIPPVSLSLNLMRNVLLPPLRFAYPPMISPTRPLGQFLADIALGRFDGRLTGHGIELVGGQSPILSNVAFRRLAGLDKK